VGGNVRFSGSSLLCLSFSRALLPYFWTFQIRSINPYKAALYRHLPAYENGSKFCKRINIEVLFAAQYPF
jgi:hypothetical protein